MVGGSAPILGRREQGDLTSHWEPQQRGLQAGGGRTGVAGLALLSSSIKLHHP